MSKKKMSNFKTFLMLMGNQGGFLRPYRPHMLMDEATTGGQGGGGGGGGNPDNSKLIADLQASNKALLDRLDKLEKGGKKGKEDEEEEEEDDDLRKKVAKEKEEEEKKKKNNRSIEDVLRYNLTIDSYVKENKEVLPDEFENILKVAEKETYDSATEKANAIKASFVQAFFTVQSNVELLTTAQKAQLDDYLKLTKNGREEAASLIYQNLFEPTIEMVKKLKKAEELNLARSGFHPGSKSGDEYKNKLIELGKKRFKIKE